MSKVWLGCVIWAIWVITPAPTFASSGPMEDLRDPPGPVVRAATATPEPQDPPRAEEKTDAQAPVPEGWRRDGLGFRKGKSKIRLAGYTQGDLRSFDWEPVGPDPESLRRKTRELRRLRIGVKAEFDRVFLELDGDPRSSQAGDRLKDALVGFTFSKTFIVQAGHFKPPVSQEFLTSGSRIDLADRAMSSDRLSPDREWGITASGEKGKFGYEVGWFAGDGTSSYERSEASGAVRVLFMPREGLVFAGSFMQGEVTREISVNGVDPDPKGGEGRAPSGFTFWEPVYVNGTRTRLAADAEYSRGPFRARGEFLEMNEQRIGLGPSGNNLSDVAGRAWSLQASYVLTGEKKGATVSPSKSVFDGGRGALEIVTRVEGMKFDAAETRSKSVSVIALGLNYWPAKFMKVQANTLWENYNDPAIAPVPGNTGRYFSVVGRLQFMVP